MAILHPAIVLFAGLAMCCLVTSQEAPHVTVGSSDVYGVEGQWKGQTYWSFLGIRYAEAPQRFMKPQSVELPPVVNATEFGAPCIPGMPEPRASEDCLFLNIYCPPVTSSDTDGGKAVMFFIHDGGNVIGSGEDKDGSILAAENDVIVVTVNYRLAALGFLYTEDDTVPGNAGLWDQHQALNWVKQSISAFGGDPARITVIGASAGAKSASAHTVSPHSRSLFARGFFESGTLYSPSFYLENPLETARLLAARVKCPTSPTVAMVSCLRAIPAAALNPASMNLRPQDLVGAVNSFTWGAVRDGDFLPLEYEPDTFQGAVLLGLNNNEGSLLYDRLSMIEKQFVPGVLDLFRSKNYFEHVAVPGYLEQYFAKNATSLATMATNLKYAHPDPSNDTLLEWRGVLDMHGDQQYITSAIRYMQEGIASENNYFYYFDYNVPKNDDLPDYLHGAHHVDDLDYVFGFKENSYNYSAIVLAREENISRVLRSYLTNFAKTGTPNGPADIPFKFPEYKTISQKYLRVSPLLLKPNVNAHDAIGSHVVADRMQLWLRILPYLMDPEEPSGTPELRGSALVCLVALVVVFLQSSRP